MKKMLALLLAFAMIFAMVACGAKEQASAPAADNKGAAAENNAEEKAPVTIKFLHWQTEISEQIQAVIDDFQEEYPWITVEQEIVPTSDGSSVTAARIAGNDAIDVIGVQPKCDGLINAPAFYENNFLMDLSSLACVANFDESVLNDEVRCDGALTSLPISSQTMCVFYNVDMFNEYGIQVPTTWSEFMAACETLKQNGIAPMALGGKDGWPCVNMTIQMMSSDAFVNTGFDVYEKVWKGEMTYEESGWGNVMDRYADMTDNGYWYENPLATAYADAPVIFATGKCAMYEDGSWSAVQISDCEPDFEVGVFALNATEDASYNDQPVKYGMTVGIANRTEHAEESKLFVEYLFSTEVYSEFVNACAYMPTEKNVTVDDKLTSTIKELIDGRTVIPFSNAFEAPLYVEGFSYDETPAVQGIISGEMTAQEAKDLVQGQIDAARAAAQAG